jgi:hypothetical protein
VAVGLTQSKGGLCLESRHLLTMELLKGQSLDRIVAPGGLPLA